MPKDFTLPDKVPQYVATELLSKTWDEMLVLEHDGYLLFPDKLHRRLRNGSVESKDIMLRVPRPHEMRQARVEARALFAEDKLDMRFDRDLFEDLETMCILAKAIRNNTDPWEPWEPDVRALEKNWDKSSIVQIWQRLDSLTTVVDPRPTEIGPEETLLLIAKLAKEQNLAPLAVYGSDAQATFVTTMAAQLLIFLDQKSSSEPSEPSTPE